MYCCGIPYIDVRGTKEDYLLLMTRFLNLPRLFDGVWHSKVQNLINEIINYLETPSFWKDIFSLVRCGSAGQVEVNGWWSSLFRKQPSVRYTHNFDTHLAGIKYACLNTGKRFEMKSGLISSVVEDNFLVPNFGHIIYDRGPLV